MQRVTLTIVLLLLSGGAAVRADDAVDSTAPAGGDTLIIVRGAGGTGEFDALFASWTARWEAAAAQGGLHVIVIGNDATEPNDHDRLESALSEHLQRAARLWLVLIGHGTFDGRAARFNLRGPDVSGAELAGWLAPRTAPTAVINCSSCSGPFLEDLSAPERIVITATRTGQEVNFSRFGDYLSQCIADPSADLDKDLQVSLLEAFLMASRRTEEFYTGQTRLVTEHALIDDDGNGSGTRAEAFRGIHPVRTTESGSVDGYRAHQWHLLPSDAERGIPAELRARRDELELELIRLRDRKADMEENAYFAELERLLIQLAEVYEEAENTPPKGAEPGS
jgi:hypothetical protein